LIDLFDGRPQLVIYQFMDNGPDAFCPGCTHFTNNVVDLSELANNDVSWSTVSDMPLAQIETYIARMGWTVLVVGSCSVCSSATARTSFAPTARPPVG
jgi:predicted dithiol-disulfide oxidoreductase (DUF899 family)